MFGMAVSIHISVISLGETSSWHFDCLSPEKRDVTARDCRDNWVQRTELNSVYGLFCSLFASTFEQKSFRLATPYCWRAPIRVNSCPRLQSCFIGSSRGDVSQTLLFHVEWYDQPCSIVYLKNVRRAFKVHSVISGSVLRLSFLFISRTLKVRFLLQMPGLFR